MAKLAMIVHCQTHWWGPWRESANYLHDGIWVREFTRNCERCHTHDHATDRRQV